MKATGLLTVVLAVLALPTVAASGMPSRMVARRDRRSVTQPPPRMCEPPAESVSG